MASREMALCVCGAAIMATGLAVGFAVGQHVGRLQTPIASAYPNAAAGSGLMAASSATSSSSSSAAAAAAAAEARQRAAAKPALAHAASQNVLMPALHQHLSQTQTSSTAADAIDSAFIRLSPSSAQSLLMSVEPTTATNTTTTSSSLPPAASSPASATPATTSAAASSGAVNTSVVRTWTADEVRAWLRQRIASQRKGSAAAATAKAAAEPALQTTASTGADTHANSTTTNNTTKSSSDTASNTSHSASVPIADSSSATATTSSSDPAWLAAWALSGQALVEVLMPDPFGFRQEDKLVWAGVPEAAVDDIVRACKAFHFDS